MDLLCTVDHNGDRRKAGSRKHVESLEQRILDLESLLHQTAQSPQQEDLFGEPEVAVRSERTAVPASSGPQTSQLEEVAPCDSPPPALDSRFPEGLLTLDSNGAYAESFTDRGVSLGRNSSRQCSGAFGPTFHHHARSSSLSWTDRHQPRTETYALADLGIAVDTNTLQVRLRLLQSFFGYQPLCLDALDEDLFWEHRKSREPSEWYSNFLENAMLACAARMSKSSAVRSLAERFSLQAKEDIVQALENSSAASMQGFLLLSEYEVSQDREQTGWQFCGKRDCLTP